MRVREALNARDVAIGRLSEACASVREKAESMQVLRAENESLRKRIECHGGGTDKENDCPVAIVSTTGTLIENSTKLEENFASLTVSSDADHRCKVRSGYMRMRSGHMRPVILGGI